MEAEHRVWKCEKCGYKMEFLTYPTAEKPRVLSICGVAGPKGNCKGRMILQPRSK